MRKHSVLNHRNIFFLIFIVFFIKIFTFYVSSWYFSIDGVTHVTFFNFIKAGTLFFKVRRPGGSFGDLCLSITLNDFH